MWEKISFNKLKDLLPEKQSINSKADFRRVFRPLTNATSNSYQYKERQSKSKI